MSAAAAPLATLAADTGSPLATNQYPWITFYKRQGRDFQKELDTALGEAAAAGFQGWECACPDPSYLDTLAPLLKKHGLDTDSIYVNSLLYDPAKAEESIQHVLAIAHRARDLGTRIIVTNPSPIRPADKNDAQIQFQAQSLDRLGEELRKLGVALAYHNHDAELRHGAREFHHMLTATRPENVKFCLDAHWVYRGCGNSQTALFDVLEMYHSRIIEVHVRNSHGGVWTESFHGLDDIDYPRLFTYLQAQGIRPRITLEQCVEDASPSTLDGLSAHRAGVEELRRMGV